VTGVKVVDASALGALLFGEPEAGAVAERLMGVRLAAPALLGFELANVCLVKIRREPNRRHALKDALRLAARLAIEWVAVDHVEALELAEATGLTAYDASYLWLSRMLGCELITLDRKLARLGFVSRVSCPAPPGARPELGTSLAAVTRRPRLNADHSPIGIGRQSAFRLIQEDEFVAEGIANARASPDRNVERALDRLAARAQEARESLVGVGDHDVRLGADVQMNDQLRVGLRKREASRFAASPQQAMAELVAIEGNRRVQIGDAEQMIVDFSKYRLGMIH
jgi:predicted nucleic acid-binding protein